MSNWWENMESDPTVNNEKTTVVVCKKCGRTIVEHNKDQEFNGVELCSECFEEYVGNLTDEHRRKKINIYED